MKILQSISAIAAMVFTTGSMLTTWVFAAASLANNTSEASLHRVKLWVLNFSLFSVVGVGLGIWLLLRKHYALSAGVSLAPAISMLLALVWQLV